MAQCFPATTGPHAQESPEAGTPETPARDGFSWESIPYPDTPPISVSEDLGDLTEPLSPVSDDEEPVIAVLGVGYVGTHLVESFSSRYNVIGFDVSKARVQQLRDENVGNASLRFTDSPQDLAPATHFLISVPTLLRPDRTIDSSYLREAIMTVSKVARRGSTVVIESSVAVGMTRQLLGPLAKSNGFFAGMSPEVGSPRGARSRRPHRMLTCCCRGSTPGVLSRP